MAIVGAIAPAMASILSAVQALWLLLPTVAVATRRLHDRDLSGWWQALPAALMLPGLIGLAVDAEWLFIVVALAVSIASIGLMVVYAFKGTTGPNRFGPDPLDESGV